MQAQLNQCEIRVVRDRVRAGEKISGHILCNGGRKIPVTIERDCPEMGTAFLPRSEEGAIGRAVPYCYLILNSDLMAEIAAEATNRQTAQEAATRQAQIDQMIVGMHARHGRRQGGQFGDFRQRAG